MKTCTQISDSGFRGKINVVSPGDSAQATLFPCKREVKSREGKIDSQECYTCFVFILFYFTLGYETQQNR